MNRKHQGMLLGILIAISFVGMHLNAQPFRMSVQDQVRVLKDSLTLTEDQEKKITKILTAQQNEMEQKREEWRGNREAARSYMMERLKKTDAEIKAVLTKEQAQKYDTFIHARRQRLMERSPQGTRPLHTP